MKWVIEMKILTVSPSRFGIGGVIYNLIKQIQGKGHQITYYTISNNPAPNGCEKMVPLDEKLTKKLQDDHPSLYTPYGIIYFWIKSYNYIRKNLEEYDVIWLHNPHPLPSIINREILSISVITLHGPLVAKVEFHSGLSKYYYQFLINLISRET
ncbi:hypothetical protein AKJ52_00085 [candidate division MSBL1 archaeon SCGC-AAA382C18]|uniref:Glycosyltransferase subfamily 4-like N-terminal domain-containing protein n=1 Tax=candidate division MSBL1 archaeon SCGC-AAA382C18 TaxID=1698281 RepID=A0A133VM16_9EURY|nr:hypothetical protein AKJ52_00085 [candidate division MSBL1 archaeon SCGC-AAA382C18]